MLKVKFGTAMASSTKENVIVSIPGLRGKEPKEVSVKNLAAIIEARMKEIIDLVNHQIQSSGYQDKLMTGIVLTGGGSQLRNLPQLVSYITGKEARVGYPNEHLGMDSKSMIKNPIYSTGVGLVQKGFELVDWSKVDSVIPMIDDENENPKPEEPPTIGLGEKFKKMLEDWFSDDSID
jgi:cell division protein FtsA